MEKKSERLKLKKGVVRELTGHELNEVGGASPPGVTAGCTLVCSMSTICCTLPPGPCEKETIV